MNGAPAELSFGDGITAAQIRIARPTDRLDEVVAFYRDGLGLPELYRFAGHDGYDGVMIGLPGRTCHVEFTSIATAATAPLRAATIFSCSMCPMPGNWLARASGSRLWATSR